MLWILGVVLIGLAIFLLMPVKDENTLCIDSKLSDSTKLPDISGSRLRSLSATDLIDRLNLEPVIENIKLHSGLSYENWQKDGLPLIHNFLLLVQRLPASESHHHAGDGGLARHTLDVAAIALRQAAGRSFPPNGQTEDIPKLTAVWKYGILVAALLHDVGKVLTGFTITLSDIDNKNQQLWLPDAGNMPINMYYSVDFLAENHRYTEHAEIGWSFFMTLVPESTRQWIGNMSPDLIHLLRSYLSGCHNNSIIEELVKSADMASVSRDLAEGSRQRFASAKRVPLIEIIMDTLQEMLSDRGRYFTIAKDAGGDLFRKGDKIYMISKNVPDFIREYLKQNKHPESHSFPTDNNRIFDTLLEYQAIIPNPFDEAKAITNIAVAFTKSDKTTIETHFTVLAFDAKTLYPDGNYPTEFAGKLEEIVEPDRRVGIRPTESTTENDPNRSGNLNHQEIATTATQSRNDNGYSASLNDNPLEPAVKEEIIVPPIMDKPADLPEPAKEDPATSLEALLGITEPDRRVGLRPTESAEDAENNVSGSLNPEPTTAFSSIDDLLNLTGLLNSESAEEQDNHSGSLNDENNLLESEPVIQENNSAKTKEEKVSNNSENTINQLESLFSNLEPIHKNPPRPIPIKNTPNLEKLSEIKQDLRIQKILSDDIPDNTDTFRYLGMKFLHWLANGLSNGTISYNTANSFIHFVEQGMLIVTPIVFREFTQKPFIANNPDCDGVKVQRSFQTLGLISRNRRRSFLYKAFNKKNQPIFSCYLIEENQLHHLIQMSTRPNNNPDLFIIDNDEIYAKQQAQGDNP